jgi:hypothetical protein
MTASERKRKAMAAGISLRLSASFSAAVSICGSVALWRIGVAAWQSYQNKSGVLEGRKTLSPPASSRHLGGSVATNGVAARMAGKTAANGGALAWRQATAGGARRRHKTAWRAFGAHRKIFSRLAGESAAKLAAAASAMKSEIFHAMSAQRK